MCPAAAGGGALSKNHAFCSTQALRSRRSPDPALQMTDVTRVLVEEAPRTARPLAGIIDPDARAVADPRRLPAARARLLEPEHIAAEIRPVQPPVDVHRPAEQARP